MEEYTITLPAKPGTVLYELSVRMKPRHEDGAFEVKVLIEEKRFFEKDLFRITQNRLYGMGKTVFRTYEEAEEAAKAIMGRGISIMHVDAL